VGKQPTSRFRAQDARRLLLHAQGLLDDPGRRGAASLPNVAKLIERIGFVQIDTINVIERAHHLILVSRIDDYDRSSLDVLQSAKHPPPVRALDA
jgi:uncharacterized protein YcaQ